MYAEVGEGLGSDDAVHEEAVSLLVGAYGGAADGPVNAVDGDADRTLDRGDPPGTDEALAHGCPEESSPRLGPDDSVDEEPVSLLEGPHGRTGLRAEDAVGANAER